MQAAAAPAIARTHVHRVHVGFGDCDPAGIVYFPNFLRWMDESSLAYFMACGMPPWRVLTPTRGIVGTPVLEVHTKFSKPASYGDTVEVHTTVTEWAGKIFRHAHSVRRGDDLLCEGTEVRTFVIHHPTEPGRLKSIPVPDDIKALCSLPSPT